MNLNDLGSIASIDRSDALGATEQLPDQVRRAKEVAAQSSLDVDGARVSSVVVSGMGGSGISGDVVRAAVAADCSVPITVVRDYYLPSFVGPDTLVFVASYSGNTEETLSTLDQARERGSQVVGVTTNGRLLDDSRTGGFPAMVIPGGLQPRQALGYLSVPILMAMERIGLASGLSEQVDETIEILDGQSRKFGRSSHVDSNPAKKIALDLEGTLPVVYGSEGIAEVAAYRWKCQINENSKSPAVWNRLPELDHNEITGWEMLAEMTRRFSLVSLRHPGEHPQVSKRFSVTTELIRDFLGVKVEVESEGRSHLARFFSLAYLGDYVSAYLAVLYGVDPTPVERIESLKVRLRS